MAPTWEAGASLLAALAVGMLIGLERGWRGREGADGSRVAGLRTFVLVGLLGGVMAVTTGFFGPLPLAAGLAGTALLATVSYREAVRICGNLSVTTAVALVLTYALGVLAGSGRAELAIGVAVMVAMLLDMKPQLHKSLRWLEHRELSAALQLGVLTVVILPLLPDAGYGPYGAINPYRVWLAVCLLAGLSLCGHVAIRLTGPQRGMFWTGLFGGLASSMAVTLLLARRAHGHTAWTGSAAAGSLAASASMFVRLAVMVFVLKPALGLLLGLPLLAAGLGALGASLWQRRSIQPTLPGAEPEPDAGGGASAALGFGLFLVAMAMLTQYVMANYGSAGLYVLAAVSGLADVDAVLITLLQARESSILPLPTLSTVTGIAVSASLLAKAVLATAGGNISMGRQVAAGYAVALLAGVMMGLVVYLLQA